jgi:hypothetical protein
LDEDVASCISPTSYYHADGGVGKLKQCVTTPANTWTDAKTNTQNHRPQGSAHTFPAYNVPKPTNTSIDTC